MPRVARIVVPGVPHHITQRGNNRQDVFFVDGDRRAYLAILKKQAARHGLAVLGYCLMDNHVHLVVTPRQSDALAKAVGRTHWLYSQYLNRRRRRSGHLWQNRFFSCPMDQPHAYAALAYIERNPVRAGLVRAAWRYPWSSAAAHVGQGDPTGLLDLATCRHIAAHFDWQSILGRPEDEEDLQRLRLHTHRGRPLGSDGFVARLEQALSRRLRPLPVGRPPKKKRPPT